MKLTPLGKLEESLRQAPRAGGSYYVPSLWLGTYGRTAAVKVDPHRSYLKAVRKILRSRPYARTKGAGGEWTRDAVVYNMFVRTTTAFDHDRDGVLNLGLNTAGMRETGTFLKGIAILPYLRKLGINTVHLLPITAIGGDGNKGTLGSPYAIRNPYVLDERLSEPSLGLDVNTQFAAFVEAAHYLGLRVVVEFVFRTAAKDSDWVRDHPEWFYWIREDVPIRRPGSGDESAYGSPVFTPEELGKIRESVSEGALDKLIPPHRVYREFFQPPPQKDQVVMEQGRYIGTSSGETRVKVPGAFADWPPDDSQPPWDDVTYLKLFDHPDYNYIAYNTIRMYDAALTAGNCANNDLWEKITGIIPYYQREFGIDGVMIDMGHALPMDLKKRMITSARSVDHDFAFWDENFSISDRSRDEGYNAVVGYLWMDEHHPSRMKEFFRRCASVGIPIPFFAGAETHNTPRAAARTGGEIFSRLSWVMNCFIPGMPFLHSGFELAETLPINTGLDFTPDQVSMLPPERLPLFSEHAYDWTRRKNLVAFLSKVCSLRAKFAGLITDPDPATFHLLDDTNQQILAFERSHPDRGMRLVVICNANCVDKEQCFIRIDTKRTAATDLLSGKTIRIRANHVRTLLRPGECLVLQL